MFLKRHLLVERSLQEKRYKSFASAKEEPWWEMLLHRCSLCYWSSKNSYQISQMECSPDFGLPVQRKRHRQPETTENYNSN